MGISGLPRQNDIWVLVPWPGIEYTIKGKVVASPKSGAVVSLVNPNLLVVRSCTKSALAMH
jgi:hypothetical protein